MNKKPDHGLIIATAGIDETLTRMMAKRHDPMPVFIELPKEDYAAQMKALQVKLLNEAIKGLGMPIQKDLSFKIDVVDCGETIEVFKVTELPSGLSDTAALGSIQKPQQGDRRYIAKIAWSSKRKPAQTLEQAVGYIVANK